MKKAILLFIVPHMLWIKTTAQVKTIEQEAPKQHAVYGADYVKAGFCGGDSLLHSYIKANLKYPDSAIANGIQGRVVIQFLIDENGWLSHFKVVKGIGGYCDEEAMSVIKSMPPWEPALYKNHATRAVQLLPVAFRLE